ncbi:hypothetical protein TURU_119217 [Turdus rufiventris]|nr:hypothetical protein TURU_119217 [Turdus rufiventris]
MLNTDNMNHRKAWVGGDLRDHLVLAPPTTTTILASHWTRLLRTPSTLALSPSMEGAATTLLLVQLFIHKNPKVLLCRAAVNEFFSQSVLMSGIDTNTSLAIRFLQANFSCVHFHLDEIPSFSFVNRTSQLHVICKLADVTLNLNVYVIDKYIKEDHPKKDPKGHHL